MYSQIELLFHDLEDLHGACLNSDAASNALGGGLISRTYHNLHGADFSALTAGGAQLLIDHVNTGLGILGDRTGLADLGALTTLDASHRLGASALSNDLNAGQIGIKLLIEGHGASTDTLKASHAFAILFNDKFLHRKRSSFLLLFFILYRTSRKIAMPKIKIPENCVDFPLVIIV